MSPRNSTKEIHPVEAATVVEGTKFFNAYLPAAVLLDIDLPDGFGLDVLRAIRNG
jgi:DNA-binding response OmpR family regulator